MAVERKLIIDKLMGFVVGEISKAEIYEWALFVVVSRDYEELVKDNKLTQEIFQFLIDIDKPRPTSVSINKVLEYFIQCLEGKKEFITEDYKQVLGELLPKAVPAPIVKKVTPVKKPLLPLTWLVASARIYALIFVLGSIVLNVVSVLKPNLFIKPNEIAPSVMQVARDAFPHVLYAFLILCALVVKVPRFVFYGFIPVGIWGMFFYWSGTTSYVLKNGFSLPLILFFLIFVALPPTAAFFVLLDRWFTLEK